MTTVSAGDLVGAGERILRDLAPPRASGQLRLVGVGWATVELARAERELGIALGDAADDSFAPAVDDEVLGAYSRTVRLAAGVALVLLEPNTEGRLAAALARWGEGVVAAYVEPVEQGRFGRSGWQPIGRPGSPPPGRPGPLGPARHLAGGRWGPHVILVGD